MTAGSIVLGTEVSAYGISDSGQAENIILTSLTSSGLDGVSIISSSVTSQGFSSSTSSSNLNISLIFGLAIGLGLLSTSLLI